MNCLQYGRSYVLVVHSKHSLAKRHRARMADIADEPFLMSTSGCEPAIRRIFNQARIEPKVAFCVRDADALVNMVGQGLGVTIMPWLAVPAETKSKVACVSIEPRQQRRIVAITKRSGRELPAVETLKAMFIRPRKLSHARVRSR